ncbi:MAG TPA: MFS transporter [Nostocaceae cyanobacterium]|nr:MFS transporter [Nostocaceae cyanobacterium]
MNQQRQNFYIKYKFMDNSKSSFNILWLRVGLLAGLQAAITLTWLVYNAYLPKLLTQFGFPATLAAGLLILENALGMILEPLMGGLSDRTSFKIGSKLPFITVGVILSSALLLAIPCILTFVPPIEVLKGILPLTLVAWAIAMTIFRSPAMSFLGRYATPQELPLAASLVTLAGGIVGAFRGYGNQFILSLGEIWAFAIASFVLLTAGFTLRFFPPPPPTSDIQTPKIPIKPLIYIFLTGASIAFGTRFLMDALNKMLKLQYPTTDISLLMLAVGLTLAAAALPAGFIGVKLGNTRTMLLGIAATICGIAIMLYMGALFPIILIIIAGFSLIVNGVIPFCLNLMPERWGGLGIGMYFGGFSLAMSLFGVMFPKMEIITPAWGGVGTISAFLLAAVCILFTQRKAEV